MDFLTFVGSAHDSPESTPANPQPNISEKRTARLYRRPAYADPEMQPREQLAQLLAEQQQQLQQMLENTEQERHVGQVLTQHQQQLKELMTRLLEQLRISREQSRSL